MTAKTIELIAIHESGCAESHYGTSKFQCMQYFLMEHTREGWTLKFVDDPDITRLAELKNRLCELETTMVHTYQQHKDRNREMFLVCREIEQLENPVAYAENIRFWEGYEIRF